MNDKPVNYDKPVAYDADGQPLYAHPVADEETDVTSQPVVPPTIVHLLDLLNRLSRRFHQSYRRSTISQSGGTRSLI